MNNLFFGSTLSTSIPPFWMNIAILLACFALIVMIIVSINLVLNFASELATEIFFVIPARISATLTLKFISTLKSMKNTFVNGYYKVKDIYQNALERRRIIQNSTNDKQSLAAKKRQEQQSEARMAERAKQYAMRTQPIKSSPMCSKPGQNAAIFNSTNTVEKTDGIDYSIPAYIRAGIDINKVIDTAKEEVTESSTSVYVKTGNENDVPASKKEVFSRREKRKALLNEKLSGKSQRIQQLYSRDFSTPSAI